MAPDPATSRPATSSSSQEEDPKALAHRKPCSLCHSPRDVLVRCQIDSSGAWNFVCPGKCWKSVSGGVIDGDKTSGEYEFYRYGGMWKNKHAGVSAKVPRRLKGKLGRKEVKGSVGGEEEGERDEGEGEEEERE